VPGAPNTVRPPNSSAYASRAFAARILHECHGNTDQRITWAWRQAVQRAPRTDELDLAKGLLDRQLTEYAANEKSAEELLNVGQSEIPADLSKTELAAWTNLARVILNLHETITRS